jgi:putative Ca2+/H+ antiporter (TMEM165/GDT1 family)
MKLDWTILLQAFLVALTAEGACLLRSTALVARLGHPVSVAVGTLLGNMIMLLPILCCGAWIHHHFPAEHVRIAAGLLFILFGLGLLCDRIG